MTHFCRFTVQIEKLVLVQPRRSALRRSTARGLTSWVMHRIFVDIGKMLWGENQEIHKITESHCNVGDVEDAICTGVVHMGKGM